MLKKFYLNLFFILMVSSTYADVYGDPNGSAYENTSCNTYEAPNWHIKARLAAFVPINSRFRDIYGKCGLGYEIEASKTFNNIEFWANINWYPKNGRSIGFDDFTCIHLLNFSLGPKYVYQMTCKNQIYISIGAVVCGIWLKNDTDFSHRHVSKAAFGGEVGI